MVSPKVKAYLDTKGNGGITIKWKTGGWDPSCLFRFEKSYDHKYRGMYVMKTLLDTKYGKIVSGYDIVQTTSVRGGRDYWNLYKVLDYPGNEWDYYRITNNHTNSQLYYPGPPTQYVMIRGSNGVSSDLWRLIPRYKAENEGYIQIRRHRG